MGKNKNYKKLNKANYNKNNKIKLLMLQLHFSLM